MAIVGHVVTSNGLFQAWAAFRHLISGCNTLQPIVFFDSSTCKIGWEGLELTTRAQNNNSFYAKLAFLGPSLHKNGLSWSRVALKHQFPSYHTLNYMFSESETVQGPSTDDQSRNHLPTSP